MAQSHESLMNTSATHLPDLGCRLAALRGYKEGAICQLHHCRVLMVMSDKPGFAQVSFTLDCGDGGVHMGSLIVKGTAAAVDRRLRERSAPFSAKVSLAVRERYRDREGDPVIPMYLRGDFL